MKRIILTGGGTAGHVTPNIALLPRLKELQYDIHYIGSYNGIEKELIQQFGIPYHGISSGKIAALLQRTEFYRSFPCCQRTWRSAKTSQDIKARCHLLQRRLCLCPGGIGRKEPSRANDYP
mgnify:CR=1 FL=1